MRFDPLTYFAFLGLFFGSIAILVGMIPFSAWRSWRCWHRGRHRASWIWAALSIAFFLLMFGWPAVEHIRLWALEARMGAGQIAREPDLRGKTVALTTGWDGHSDGRDDCEPLRLGAARVFALAPVGNQLDSRTDGLRVDLRQPADLTKFLGPEMVLRHYINADGDGYERCESIANSAAVKINYVILKDASFAYLPGAFQQWFSATRIWGVPSAELYAGPVADPTQYQPRLTDTDILLTEVQVWGHFTTPLLVGLKSSETVSWRNGLRAQDVQTACALLHVTCTDE